MKTMQILMNKPVYLGLSILEISKTVIHESWYDYVKLKYGGESKIMLHGYKQLCSLYKEEDIFIDIGIDVKTRYDTSNYELDRPLPKEKNL